MVTAPFAWPMYEPWIDVVPNGKTRKADSRYGVRGRRLYSFWLAEPSFVVAKMRRPAPTRSDRVRLLVRKR